MFPPLLPFLSLSFPFPSSSAVQGPDISSQMCWVGGFTQERCCLADPSSRPDCWEGVNYDDCCPNAECWEEPYSFSRCCDPSFGEGGNPACWSGRYSAEYCCHLKGSVSWYNVLFDPVPQEEFYTIEDFYSDSQYGLDFGYYSRGRVLSQAKVALNGTVTEEFAHFTTFPMALSPHFGNVLCRKVFMIWWASGMPDYFPIVELGAGSGQLADDLLKCFKAPYFAGWKPDLEKRFLHAIDYLIAERSPALAARQRQRGLRNVEIDAQDPDSCAEIKRNLKHSDYGSALVLSNELLDAFAPVKLRLSVFETDLSSCSSWLEVRIMHVISRQDLKDTYRNLLGPDVDVESYVSSLSERSSNIACTIARSSVGRAALDALRMEGWERPEETQCVALVLGLSGLIDHNDLQLPHAAHNMRIRLRNEAPLRQRLAEIVRFEGKELGGEGADPVIIPQSIYRELRHLLKSSLELEVKFMHHVLTRRINVPLAKDRCDKVFKPWIERHKGSIQRQQMEYAQLGHYNVQFGLRPGEENFVKLADCILGASDPVKKFKRGGVITQREGRGWLLTIDYGAPFEPLAYSMSSTAVEDGVAIPPIPSTYVEGLPDDCLGNWMRCPGFVDLTSFVDFTNVARAGDELGFDRILYGPQSFLEKMVDFEHPFAPPIYCIVDNGLNKHSRRHVVSWYGNDEALQVQRWTSFKALLQSKNIPLSLARQVAEEVPSFHLESERMDKCWGKDVTMVPMNDRLRREGLMALFNVDQEKLNFDYARGYEDVHLAHQLVDWWASVFGCEKIPSLTPRNASSGVWVNVWPEERLTRITNGIIEGFWKGEGEEMEPFQCAARRKVETMCGNFTSR